MSARQAAQVGHLRSGSRIARPLAAIGLLGWLLAATDAAAAIRLEADRDNPLAVTLIA